MGLIDTLVKTKWSYNNKAHYIQKGYLFTNIGDVFLVKSSDLTHGSHAFVDVVCDGENCENPYYNTQWQNFLKCVREDGKYYCSFCTNKLFVNQKSITTRIKNNGNIIYLKNPNLIPLLLNIEDAYKYSIYSQKKVDWKCPVCNYIIKNKSIKSINNNGINCPRCSDNISYPEKFIYNMLMQLDIDFIYQLTKQMYDWCEDFRYDFYINSINCIVEAHGEQHYKYSGGKWSSLEEIQYNDNMKKDIAISNGVKYIILNCSMSDTEWIKNKILNSELGKLLDLSNVNWLECHEFASNSLIKVICDKWNENKNYLTKDICEIMNLSMSTIIKYLKQGAELGWCDYNPIDERSKNYSRQSKKVVCVNTGEIFQSITEAHKYYNTSISGISNCCKNINGHAGNHPITNEPLVWQFYNDYLLSKKSDKTINKKFKKVICLNTSEIFNSITEASKKYNIGRRHISTCCLGKRKSTGIHPVTKEKLRWSYIK